MDNGWQHKEQNTDTFYHNDGPQKHDAKEKKPDIKDYICTVPLTGDAQKRQIYRDKKISDYLRWGGGYESECKEA